MGKPDTLKTVKNHPKTRGVQKTSKKPENHQKCQKWPFCKKLWGLGRDFYQKRQFWQVHFGPLKNHHFRHFAILTGPLFPKEAWWTAVRLWDACSRPCERVATLWTALSVPARHGSVIATSSAPPPSPCPGHPPIPLPGPPLPQPGPPLPQPGPVNHRVQSTTGSSQQPASVNNRLQSQTGFSHKPDLVTNRI